MKTEMLEFMEDINDTKIFRCKKCCWYSHNEICLNPVSEYSNKNVKYVKGCEDYHNYDEPHISSMLDDELQGTLF